MHSTSAILIIDDDEVIVDLIVEILIDDGYVYSINRKTYTHELPPTNHARPGEDRRY